MNTKQVTHQESLFFLLLSVLAFSALCSVKVGSQYDASSAFPSNA